MARAPVMDGRDRARILSALLARAPGFVPEWTPQPGDPGHAWASIVARYLELQGAALDRMPDAARIAFLDLLGNSLQPAQPARTPLVFTLMETAPLDITLAQGTRVAAQLPPAAPTLSGKNAAPVRPAPQYYTEQTIRLTRAAIAAAYSVDPQSDTYVEHTAALASGFRLFDAMRLTPHVLYLGHDEFLRLAGDADIVLTCDVHPAHERKPYRPLLLDWEYLSADGWLPLELVEDGTQRLTLDGAIRLRKQCGPDSKEETIAGRTSHWIRATVSPRVPSARIAAPPGYRLELDLVPNAAAGLRVTLDDKSYARVLAVEGRTLTLDAQLSGAADGAALKRAAEGTVVGTIARLHRGYRVPVEDARELLAGDVVTADGASSSRIDAIDGAVLVLERPLHDAQPGVTVALFDALPPLSPEASAAGLLPTLDVVRVRVGFTKGNLPPDSAYVDTLPADTANHFHPLGRQPARYTTFYLASRETFQRRNARVVITFVLAQAGRGDDDPQLTPEYFDGTQWREIASYYEYEDGSANFTEPAPAGSARVTFICPGDWQETQVNGEQGYFLRFRLDSGHYGTPMDVRIVSGAGGHTVETVAATLKPPIVASVRLAYTYYTDPDLIDHCVTYNDFAYVDRTEDARWPRRPFQPFVPVGDTAPALHFAFGQRLPAGLVSLFVHVPHDAAAGPAPLPFVWEYRAPSGWSELSVLDETGGLRASGMIQFVGPGDMAVTDGMGGRLARVRARLKPGFRIDAQRLWIGGLWLNAVWASQGEHVDRETLGIANGDARQTFVLPALRVPVLPGETVEVREWAGRGDDWETAVHGVAAGDLRFEVDPRDNLTKTAVWVRWRARPHLYASRPDDRHYVIERASGTFRFGGLGFGMVPPAGARIVASFATGGGLAGNVAAGTITELRSAVGYVESVTNPLAATGGVETEGLPVARERATQRLRHRGRAVSASDYEWLAYEATPEVARARCLPLLGPAGAGDSGQVSLLVVPHSTAPVPQPTPELTRRVLAHVRANAPAGIAHQVHVIAPRYVRVSVRAELAAARAEDAALVESRVREALERHLHPLTGRSDGAGWQFGDGVYVSEIAVLLEALPGVDHVASLQLDVGDVLQQDHVAVPADALVASGEHQLKLTVGGRVHAAA